ncbi:MAG: SLBB domain-containing protein [Prevotella sp.]|nr:SLBB domain-containing protein [Prevotella sp.]
MTDDQVIKFVIKEHEAGSSQTQIVTKLMQNGVDIQQIRRVKAKYDRQIKQGGLGAVADDAVSKAEKRMRKNNGETKDEKVKDKSNLRLEGGNAIAHTFDDEDEDFLLMQSEMQGLIPTDSIEWLNQILEERQKEKKKVFGRDIFNQKNLTFEPNMNIATPQTYRVGPGDEVIVDIYGASQKSIETTVSPDGEIVIEGFGPVQVSGLTVAQATARLRSQLGSRYKSSNIKLSLGQTRTIMVNVMGEVKAPGTYTLSAFASVFHALYMAGGTNDLGTLRNIKVYRNSKLITIVDIYDYILNGKLTGNVRLSDNDVIVVGAYDCMVNITGKVKRPMYYEMKKNESVGTLLKYAGGFTGDAYTKSVRVVRKTGKEYSVFNVEEFDMSSFHVTDGDSVSVDSVLARYENTVEVKGAIFRPGMYQLGGGINSVRSLIEHAEGITEDAFINRAVMHRMKEDRTLEVISVDVKGIMSGATPDIPLKENDVLFIPTKQEAMVERTITIHGEVQFPGVYKYADNETLEDFVLQAGGLKETASTMKVDVARRVSNPKALTTDSVIARTYSFALKDGFVIEGEPGFILEPFDEVYVRKSPGYSTQQNVVIQGQVMFSGTYTLSTKNERLSDLVKKAGGVTDLAYIPGARLERVITPEERLRMQTVLRMANTQSGNDSVDVKKLDLGETYFVGIELDKALSNPGGDADLVLRTGDRLIVPEYNGTVKISGDVMFPNTVAYQKGKRVSYYIDQAGGWGNRAKKRSTHIIYMNGTVAKVGHKAKVLPGCEIVVPSKPKNSGMSLAEWMTIGTSVASIATMIATIANLIK